MKVQTGDAIRKMTLQARKLLMEEVSEQLEGIYGLLPDGELQHVEEYPVLATSDEAAATRERLEKFIESQKEAGVNPVEARKKLVKEAAFTWLNRFVAFKMMESRKLIRQSITRGQESNGFKMWLTEPGNEAHLDDYEKGDLPQDGLGEGPRQRAYRQFLLAQCANLSRELRVLFDPDTLASRFFPRPKALRKLIGMLNIEELEEAWQPGNEETIGWVYQGFNEEEKKDVFRRFYRKKEKVRAQDIPAATQIFTPRWIVRFLVENTLGRMWVEMHPDSELVERLEYLVPLETGEKLELRSVRDIRFLDPACGTMHFGLVAFDIFVEMYEEEMAHVGEPGWPENPPIDSEEDIPAAIIAHNIHGIDIDLRAVQLSALTLFLKAKTFNPKAKLTESRLACADIHMLDGNRLQQFLEQVRLDKSPIYRRILTALQQRLKDAEQLGSLLRLEQEISTLVEEERKRYEREGRNLSFLGWSERQFDTEAGKQEFWEMLEIQIGQALDEFARRQAASGNDHSFFAGETTKGLRLLELMSQRYDVVVTNPPYMTSRNMNSLMKGYLQKKFPLAKSDLYAAFLQRCAQWLAKQGHLGMITQQSFMFISSYEKLRSFILDQFVIETVAHLGPRAFEEVTGEKVNTTAFVLRRELDKKTRETSIGTYFRLVKEPNCEAKQRRFEEALANLRSGLNDPIVYRYRQGDFDAIPGSPWVYWITPGLRRIFEHFPKLKEIAEPRVGLQTSDNFRFLRYWWEIGTTRIAFGCKDSNEAKESGKRWFPHMKGGSFQRWYGNQEYILNWKDDGFELRSFQPSVIRNPDYYFRRGVTFNRISSNILSVRYVQNGFIFDCNGPIAFGKRLLSLLGMMNSLTFIGILSFLAPTITFQVGDVALVPVPEISSNTLINLVNKAIKLAKADSEEDETTWDFIAPPDWPDGNQKVAERHAQLAQIEREIDEEVYRLYGISEKDRKAIEEELGSGNNEQSNSSFIIHRSELAKRWISYAVGIALGRFQPGVGGAIGRGKFPDRVAAQLRKLASVDGIMVLDSGHPEDLAVRVFEALQIMLGEEAANEVVSVGVGRGSNPEEQLRKYFAGKFFKEHIKQYRKRPAYWLLQSPRKKYSIWLFHEKLTGDTLYRIRGEGYVGSKIKLLESQLAELREQKKTAEGRERRRLEREIADKEDTLDDIREFSRRIDAVIQRGYTPHIDDGVLINMAPLWELIPSWKAEPKKCWERLERGDYDWSHQAMDHWPERVLEKCKTNKSYAIAHGVVGK